MNLKILQINDSCTGCGACTNICPNYCLSLKPDDEGFFYPTYDASNCIECGLCENTCHIVNKQNHPSLNPDNFYLYRSNDDSILQSSSSGGGFTLFAQWILNKGGVVFGSRYNGKHERLEVFSTKDTSLASLRKSKYLESFTGNSFSEIRKLLLSGNYVLYCGTPCQVRGLKQYLKVTHTNIELLLTMDFACHGVPSNLFFNKFKEMFEKGDNKVVDVDFRHKDFSKFDMMWHNMTLRLAFSDGSEKIIPRFSSSSSYYYYEPFLNNLFLRKSCYKCDISLHSDADISLGDFWGINKHRPDLDDNKGMSFISINNSFYLSVWNELSKGGFSEKLPFDAIAYQYVDKRDIRAKQRKIRDEFIKSIITKGYKHSVIEHYGKIHIMKSIVVQKAKNIIKKLIQKRLY